MPRRRREGDQAPPRGPRTSRSITPMSGRWSLWPTSGACRCSSTPVAASRHWASTPSSSPPDFPDAPLILAHARICDLSWIWRVAPDHPNLMFDTAWWMPADLRALFTLVPPGQIVFASDAPYGHTAMSATLQAPHGNSRRSVSRADPLDRVRAGAEDRRRRAPAARGSGRGQAPAGPARAARSGLGVPDAGRDRLDSRGSEGAAEMLALARLACDIPDDIDDAPVFAAIRRLIDIYDEITAEDPEGPAPQRIPDPRHHRGTDPRRAGPGAGLRTRGLNVTGRSRFAPKISRSPISVNRSSTLIDRSHVRTEPARGRGRRSLSPSCSPPSSSRSRPTIPSTWPANR